jgi:Tfp pilus assembly protein PilE
MKNKHAKGISTMDLSIYIVIAAILLTAGLVAYNSYQDRARRNTVREELNALAQACVNYQSDSATGSLPTDLGKLVTGLTAAQTVDGVIRGSYVAKTTWTTDATTFTDPWGSQYVYNTTARTITSNGSGSAITKSF